MITAELYSWVVRKIGENRQLIGIVKNDSKNRFPDGRRIFTSLIQRIDGDLAYTANSIYRLCDEWEGEWTHREMISQKVITETGPLHTNQF